MPAKNASKKRKPIRYKTITITVTARQKRSLVNFCKARRTTPTRVIKNSIKPLLQNYHDLQFTRPNGEKVNQLELFD